MNEPLLNDSTIRFAAVACALLVAAGTWSLPGRAALRPIPKKVLAERSTLIAEVTVLSSTRDSCSTSGPRRSCQYHSRLRVDKVLGGKGKKGQELLLRWEVLSWVGKVHAAASRSDSRAKFYPCERAKVYLSQGLDGTWRLAGWNGKVLLEKPPRPVGLPVSDGQTARCVDGKVVTAPEVDAGRKATERKAEVSKQQRAVAAKPKATASTGAKPKDKVRGCSYAASTETPAGGFSLVLLGASALLVMRRRLGSEE